MDKPEPLKGYVALIDVLGFRDLVGRDDELKRVAEYSSTIIDLLGKDNIPERLQFVLFSDNLVVNTKDESETSFEQLVIACSNLAFALASQGIASRGAISHGSFIRSPTDRRGVIVAGRPIVEANDYQHRQDWVGILLSPSVVLHDRTLADRCVVKSLSEAGGLKQWVPAQLGIHLRRWPHIPFQKATAIDEASYDGFVVVPVKSGLSNPQQVIDSLLEMSGHLKRMKECAPDPRSQQKYSRSIQWLEENVMPSMFHIRD
jgi:hypothetical protein